MASPHDIDPITLTKHPITAAVLGALVGLRFAPGLTWPQRAINATSSVALAAIFGPAAAELLKLGPMSAYGLAGAIGLFGLGLAEQVQAAVQRLDVGALLKSLIPSSRKE